MCDLLWKYCGHDNFFFFTFTDFVKFFFPCNAIAIIAKTKFFFFIFSNGIATIAKTFFFFFYIFGNAVATIAIFIFLFLFLFLHFRQCHNRNCQNKIFIFLFFIFFIFYIFGNAIATIAKTNFFFSQFRQCHCHN